VSIDDLLLCCEYLTEHNGKAPPDYPKPLTSSIMLDFCTVWDADFADRISKEPLRITTMISAANFLEIIPLVNLMAVKMASMIQSQPLRKIANIISGKLDDPVAEEKVSE
jgi:hypothetical protein